MSAVELALAGLAKKNKTIVFLLKLGIRRGLKKRYFIPARFHPTVIALELAKGSGPQVLLESCFDWIVGIRDESVLA